MRATCAAYLPWISLVATMLDSYADQAEDAAGGAAQLHRPLSLRGGGDRACLRDRARSCPAGAGAARRRQAHRDRRVHGRDVPFEGQLAHAADAREHRTLAAAGGSLSRLLLPVLRLWRVLYAQRDE